MLSGLHVKSSPAITLPNIVLAGTPKSGTSSLFSLLASHPDVCGSSPKETFYFIDEHSPLRRTGANYHDHGLERYTFFSRDKIVDASFFLEGTTHYLYQDTALNFFAALQPQPHVIFILRKPSDRIFSSFSYTQNNLARLDRSVSFAQFVDLLLEDNLESIKQQFHSKKSFFVLKNDLFYSQYDRFLTRWAERFSADHLHILLFEEFKANPQTILSTLVSQIGINPSFYEQLKVKHHNKTHYNQTMSIKHSFVHRALRHFAPHLPNFQLKSTLKSLYFRLQSLNSTAARHDIEALHRLDNYFIPYNHQLAQTFSLNLHCWS